MILGMFFAGFEADPLQSVAAGVMFLFLSVAAICVFSFISISVWTDARRKEREAYYKAEAARRLTDLAGQGVQAVIEIMREEERIERQKSAIAEVKRLEGLKIGAVVNIGVGIALYAFMRSVGGPGMVGAFPFAIGMALAVYAYVLANKKVGPV